ncbi:Anti-sigma-K factor rskA [Prosthecobacter debontii]|uniref:Regulator of SigK n=1 Tax=Prosthecobacter debontii TaxID=48467 RepID=A0A1T4YY15_9BACT|nr:anti-sigma factor [Prosthecobacter debontii]SKB06448.1 Anti-sigma-K factor rskA [Prosthecobacter debontii]
MNEECEELAALSALGSLTDEERSAFEIEVARDSELEALTSDMEKTTAALMAAAPAVQPPAELRSELMAEVRRRISARKPAQRTLKRTRQFLWVGWGLAAALAAGAFLLWSERAQLAQQVAAMTEVEAEARHQLILVRDERDLLEEKHTETLAKLTALTKELEMRRQSSSIAELEVKKLNHELATLQKRDALAQVQIATLQSSVEAYKQGVAVVVWDSEKAQGVLKLEKMPPVEAGKDYQLWVVDPKKPAPVDAGVVRVNADGFAKVDFKPVSEISEAAKFALSVEKEGGVPKGEGPIVLIGP